MARAYLAAIQANSANAGHPRNPRNPRLLVLEDFDVALVDLGQTSHPWQAGILERAERLKSRKPGVMRKHD